MASLVRLLAMRASSRMGGASLLKPAVVNRQLDARRWMATKKEDEEGTKESEIELRPEEERKPKGMYKGEVVYEVPEPTARGSDLEIPDSRDYATGMERLEIELGTDRIAEGPEGLVGKFGTAEEPSFIESAFGERIVGCTGQSYPNDHDVLWMWVRSGKMTICPYCQQHFALKDLTFATPKIPPEPEAAS